MSTDQNKALVRRFYEEVFSQGNLALIDELFAPNYRSHSPNQIPGVPENRDGLRTSLETYRRAFPDIHFTIHDIVAEGDRVICRFTGTGTQKGELMGIPASGKKTAVTGTDIERIENGKFVEGWLVFDMLGLLQQLGVVQARGVQADASASSSRRTEKRPPDAGTGVPTA